MFHFITEKFQQPLFGFDYVQKIFKSKSFFKYNIMALVLSNFAAAFNYITSVYLARNLSVEGYGLFYSLQASSPVFFSMAAFVPCSILNAVTAYKDDVSKSQHVLSNLLLLYTCLAVLLIGGLFFFLEDFMRFLNITDYGLMVIFAFTWIPILALGFIQGIVQGHLLFKHLTLKDAFLSLVKISIMVVLISGFKFDYRGAAIAECLSTLIILIWIFFSVRKCVDLPRYSLKPFLWKDVFYIWKLSFLPAISMSFIGFLMMVDIVVVKHFFTDFESGIYTAGATLGRIPFIFSGVLVTLLFPQISHEYNDHKSALKSLSITAGIVGGSAIFFSLILMWQGSNVISMLFGSSFRDSFHSMKWVLISSSALAVINVLFNYMMAKRWWSFLIPSIAIFGYSFHQMYKNPPLHPYQIPESIAWMLLKVGAVCGLFMVYYHRKSFECSS